MQRISRFFELAVVFVALIVSACCPPAAATPVPRAATPVPRTATPVPPKATPVPPKATRIPPTATPVPSTPTLEVGSCSISGKAIGDARYYGITLYGPNDRNRFRAETKFDASGNYRFSGLPNGHYWVKVGAKVDAYIPPEREVDCAGGQIINVDFDLK
jgi:hypothetical protein